MTENQKSFITWSIVLLLAVAAVLVFVCTVPDLSSVERIAYRTNNQSAAPTSSSTTLKQTTPGKTGQTTVETKPAPTEPATIAYPLDINTATREELMTIPGIGETYADRIITYREENGAFSSLDELLNIKGIGEKRLTSFSEYLMVTE